MSILRFNATVPWNGQSIAPSVTHGCVHDSRPYLLTIAVFHGFFLLRFIIIVIFIKIFVLIFFCRFLWQRQEDRNTSNLTCSVPSTWRISPSESCLARVTRLARNCRKQKGTRLWMSDFYSPPCGLLIQPTLIAKCSLEGHFRKCPSCQSVRGWEAGVFAAYYKSMFCRVNKSTSAELLTIQTSQKFLDESSYSHRDTKTTLCQVFLRVTVSFRLKKWN